MTTHKGNNMRKASILFLIVFLILSMSVNLWAEPPPNDELTEQVLELIDQGQLDEALALCDEDIGRHWNKPVPYCLKAQVLLKMGEYERAVSECDYAIEIAPDAAFAYHMRGEIYHEMKEYDNAIRDYTNAIDVDPDWSPPYVSRGTAYMKKQMYDAAIADFNKSLKIDPDYTQAKVSILWAQILKNIWFILGSIIILIGARFTLIGRKG